MILVLKGISKQHLFVFGGRHSSSRGSSHVFHLFIVDHFIVVVSLTFKLLFILAGSRRSLLSIRVNEPGAVDFPPFLPFLLSHMRLLDLSQAIFQILKNLGASYDFLFLDWGFDFLHWSLNFGHLGFLTGSGNSLWGRLYLFW